MDEFLPFSEDRPGAFWGSASGRWRLGGGVVRRYETYKHAHTPIGVYTNNRIPCELSLDFLRRLDCEPLV